MAKMGKKEEKALLLRAFNKAIQKTVDACEAKRHFMEGGTGVSCFVWVSVKIIEIDEDDRPVGRSKIHKICTSSNCLGPTIDKKLEKLPPLRTERYVAIYDGHHINLD